MTFNVSDPSPILSDVFVTLHDHHNNIIFIVDTASPKSLITLETFAHEFVLPFSEMLLTADGRPLQQEGSLDLTLDFSNFPNRHFTHRFIIADVAHPMLGLDFLSKYQFSIDVASKSVTILHSDDQHSLPPLQSIEYSITSYSGIIGLFPDLTSFTLTSQKRHSCEHILEVEGPPVAFRPRCLSSEKQGHLTPS